MDPIRQIRLIIAPFFFFLSLGLALWPLENPQITTTHIIGIIGISTLPLGFLISNITIILLRLIFRIFGRNYETDFTVADVNRIWDNLNIRAQYRDELFPQNSTRINKSSLDNILDVTIIHDHGILYNNNRGIHEWIMRAYSGFVISINSVMAIIFSYIVAFYLDFRSIFEIKHHADWLIWTSIVLMILLVGALRARDDLFRTTRFQTYRDFDQMPKESNHRYRKTTQKNIRGIRR